MKNPALKLATFAFLLGALLLLGVSTGPYVQAAAGKAVVPQLFGAAPALVPAQQGCSGQPQIQYAYANPPSINSGQTTTLYWGLVGNANAAFLQAPNGQRTGIGTPGSRQVNPTQTSTWFVVGVCGSVETQVPITVTVNNSSGCNGTPQLNGFSANPTTINAGQSTTLSWGPVLNAQSAQLSSQNQGGSGVPTPGSVVVTPSQTTTYYLTAWCQGNSVQAQVTVTVNNAPPTPPPSSGNSISSIQKSGLTSSTSLVITVNYFWNGQDAPANMQATAYNSSGQQVGQSNATRINANTQFHANLNFTPYPPGMTSVTACMIGSSGTELVCQSTPMQ